MWAFVFCVRYFGTLLVVSILLSILLIQPFQEHCVCAVSSGSDEEETLRGEELACSATDSSKNPLPPLPSESTAGASRKEGAYQVSSKETGGGVPAEAASADNEGQGDSEEAPEASRRFSRGGGGRRAVKSTWQVRACFCVLGCEKLFLSAFCKKGVCCTY